MEDDDGWGIVGMAIQGSCGHREREAVVRAVVGRWGLEAGDRQGRDRGKSRSKIVLMSSRLDTTTYRCDHLDTTSHLFPPHPRSFDLGSDRQGSDSLRFGSWYADSRGNRPPTRQHW
jgi:hypothetical protein